MAEPTTVGAHTAAALFDIDGTLVDSNYLQVQTWSGAFDAVGQPADDARIHRAIALDSAKLLETLLGDGPTNWENKLRSCTLPRTRNWRSGSGLSPEPGTCSPRWPLTVSRWSWPGPPRATSSRCRAPLPGCRAIPD